jgi:hypothetical protein
MERIILIMQMRKILLILPLFFLFLVFPVKAYTYNIYNCGATISGGTPDNPNVYILQNDISMSGTYGYVGVIDCLRILGSNVILDLNGHQISMNISCSGAPNYNNVYAIDSWTGTMQNITIKNGTISVMTDYCYVTAGLGLAFGSSTEFSYSKIQGIYITINSSSTYSMGLSLGCGNCYVTNNTIYDLSVEGAKTGVYFYNVWRSNYTKGKISNTQQYDLYLIGSKYNYICAEFNVSKVLDSGGEGNSINLCPYTPPPTCNCTDWVAAECVSGTQRKYTRVCTPSGCDVETKYENDASCAPIAGYPWLSLVNIMLSPFWIIMAMVFGMSAAIEKKLQAGGIAFLAALLIFLFIFAFFTRSIPLWIPIIFLIMAAGYMIFRGRA